MGTLVIKCLQGKQFHPNLTLSHTMGDDNNTSVYVGGLSFYAEEHDLQDIFGKYGNAQVNIIKDRETQRSRGFAFVRYDTRDQAQSAIDSLNGVDIKGRNVLNNFMYMVLRIFLIGIYLCIILFTP